MKIFIKGITSVVLCVFSIVSIVPPSYAAEIMLPPPGMLIDTSHNFVPVMLKGLRVHQNDPFQIDFMLDTGDTGLDVKGSQFRSESQKLIKYFLAALAVKESDLWVNLSPYEKERQVGEALSKTVLGQDMLAQDYVLKQLTASLSYPEKALGRQFWDRLYSQAKERFGVSEIPLEAISKVWIVPQSARVRENADTVFVEQGHLKLMLEEDYLASREEAISQDAAQDAKRALYRQVLKELVLPAVEKEVNEGAQFASLRQMFYGMILAAWYKQALKGALLNQSYSGQGKTGGVDSADPQSNAAIYERYLAAYHKGVFDYIKEDIDVASGESVPRRYFSGGNDFSGITGMLDKAQLREEDMSVKKGQGAIVVINFQVKNTQDKTAEWLKGLSAAIISAAKDGDYTRRVNLDSGFYVRGIVDYKRYLSVVQLFNSIGEKQVDFVVPGDVVFTTNPVLIRVMTEAVQGRPALASKPESKTVGAKAQAYDEVVFDFKNRILASTSLHNSLGWAIAERNTKAVRSLQALWLQIVAKKNFTDVLQFNAIEFKNLLADIFYSSLDWREATFITSGSLPDAVQDMAQSGSAEQAADLLAKGGIDLAAGQMALEVQKDAGGIQLAVSAPALADFQNGDFSGLTPMIIQVIPIIGSSFSLPSALRQ